jgi:hypothetical protein
MVLGSNLQVIFVLVHWLPLSSFYHVQGQGAVTYSLKFSDLDESGPEFSFFSGQRGCISNLHSIHFGGDWLHAADAPGSHAPGLVEILASSVSTHAAKWWKKVLWLHVGMQALLEQYR